MELDLNALPKTLADLIDVLGEAAALRLVEHFGGVRIYVPHDIQPDHPLHECLGAKAAAALSRAYGGDPVPIPNCKAAMRAARNRAILMKKGSMTAAKVALHYGITDRQVYSIWAAGDDSDSPQQSLL